LHEYPEAEIAYTKCSTGEKYRLAVDMKFYIHIHTHIHRFFVAIHKYIHINTVDAYPE